MKIVILAGGFGTRISEESYLKPKPMIDIGGMPILWHIMKWYSKFGYTDFILCCGYKQHIIKEFFADYFLYNSDVTFNFSNNGEMIVHNHNTENWKVTVIDTGLNTMTGGRVKRIQKHIGEEAFMLTYGDGVSDVDLSELLKYHKDNKKIATLTGIIPEGRFGVMDINGNLIQSFREKSKSDAGWINGGFMVLEPQIFDYILDDDTILEREPLEKLANKGQLACYRHYGFWQCMDTLRDKDKLEKLIATGTAPWKYWD